MKSSKPDLTTAAGVLAWTKQTVTVMYNHRTREISDVASTDTETAAELARAMRVLRAFEEAWEHEGWAGQEPYPPSGPGLVAFAHDLRAAADAEPDSEGGV